MSSKPKINTNKLLEEETKAEIKNLDAKERAINRRIRANVTPSALTKFFSAINPQKSLGGKASTFFEVQSTDISVILIFTLIAGIISIFMYRKLLDDQTANKTEEHLVLAALVILWFAFINFFFLVFDATKLLNILLFMTIIILIGYALSKIGTDNEAGKLGISLLVFAIIPFSILLYYFTTSDSDELRKIKTLENERLRKEKFAALIEQKCKVREEKAVKALESKYREEYGIRQRISESVLESFESGRFSSTGKSKKKTDKKKKEEDGDEEDAE